MGGKRLFHRASRAFTLIELLVVISLISLILSVVTLNLSSNRRSARDAFRQTTLAGYGGAIEQFKTVYGTYLPSNKSKGACNYGEGQDAPSCVGKNGYGWGGITRRKGTGPTENPTYRSLSIADALVAEGFLKNVTTDPRSNSFTDPLDTNNYNDYVLTVCKSDSTQAFTETDAKEYAIFANLENATTSQIDAARHLCGGDKTSSGGWDTTVASLKSKKNIFGVEVANAAVFPPTFDPNEGGWQVPPDAGGSVYPDNSDPGQTGECPVARNDIVFVVDHSGSMWEDSGTGMGPNKMEAAKDALRAFINRLKAYDAVNPSNIRVGIVGFGDYADPYSSTMPGPTANNQKFDMSANYDKALEYVTRLQYGGNAYGGGGTCAECGFVNANLMFEKFDSPDDDTHTEKHTIIFLTDGFANVSMANYPLPSTLPYTRTGNSNVFAEPNTIDAANYGFNRYDYRIYSIGYGKDSNPGRTVNRDFLEELAIDITGGNYYNGTDPTSINNAFNDIFQQVVAATVSGKVYEEKNGIDDYQPGLGGDQVLSGWPVELYKDEDGVRQQVQQVLSTTSGSYMLQVPCTTDTFTIREIPASGYNQVWPVTPSTYTVNVTTDSTDTFIDKNFGNSTSTTATVGRVLNYGTGSQKW